jgi:hypothetical protein
VRKLFKRTIFSAPQTHRTTSSLVIWPHGPRRLGAFATTVSRPYVSPITVFPAGRASAAGLPAGSRQVTHDHSSGGKVADAGTPERARSARRCSLQWKQWRGADKGGRK